MIRVVHPGYWHSGNISDGSLVTCCGCGAMMDCHEPDETLGHELVCTWTPAAVEPGEPVRGPRWEQDAPDHWGCDLPGRVHLSVWPRSRDGHWVWEVFQMKRDADTPASSGDEASFEAAKSAAVTAAAPSCPPARSTAPGARRRT